MGAVDLGIKLSNSALANTINQKVNAQQWRKLWRGIDFVVGRAANCIMIITSLQTLGTQSTACDTVEGLMNASFMVEDENGKQFEVGIRVYTYKLNPVQRMYFG